MLVTRTIPNAVVNEVLWWISSPATQAHPKVGKGPVRSNVWTGRSVTRPASTTARVSIGAACRYALYAWTGAWTEADLAEAVAEVTRRVDAKLAEQARVRTPTPAQQNTRLNRLLRQHRNAQVDVMAQVERYLARQRRQAPPDPSTWQAEIRERASAEPVRRCQSVYRDGAWWSSPQAHQAHLDAQAEQAARDAQPRRVTLIKATPSARRLRGAPDRGVTLGDLARVAAEVNGRRI
jgi:hypothetical protein